MAIENIDMSKFARLFSTMERQLVMQSSFLESMYNIAVEDREDRISRENELDIARVEAKARYDQSEDVGNAPTINEEQKTNIFSSILGMIPGILGGISMAGIGSILIKGGMLAILAPAIGKFVEGIASTALTEIEKSFNLGLSEEFKNSVSSALGDAAKWASIGKMIGGRVGGIFAATGFVYSQIYDNLDIGKDGKIASGFLKGFDPEEVSGFGAALGGAFALALPSLIPAIAGPLIGLLMGPIGLAAVTAAVIVGGATLFGNYLSDKRAEFIKEIDKLVGQGIEGMKNEKDVGFLNSLGIQMGLTDPSTTTEAMIGLEATASNFKTVTTRGGRGPLTPAEQQKSEVIDWNTAEKVLDPEAYKTLVDQAEALKNSIKEPSALIGLTDSKLEQLRRLSVLFGHTESVAIIDKEKPALAKRAEVDRLKASGLYGDYVAPPVSTTSAEMAIPGVTFSPNGEIIRPKLNALTPSTNSMAKVDQLEQRAAQDKQRGTTMNSVSNPTYVGGATNVVNNNNNYNVLSSASQGLDHMVP